MKKIFSCAMIVAMAFALVSCGGEKKAEKAGTLAPAKTEVKGALSEYYTVVEKTYDIDAFEKNVLKAPIIAIELKKTKEIMGHHGFEPVGTFGQGVYGNYGFGIKVTDANGKQVLSVRADEGGMNGVYSSDDLKDLWELEPGETGIVRWSAEELKDVKGEYKFEITSYAK
jgi:hypothetical protein